jgi:hypothetical protein
MKPRLWIGIVLIGLAVAGILVSSLPTGAQKVIIPISIDPEMSGMIELTVPVKTRVGDSSSVRMVIEITDGASDSALEMVSHFEIGGVGVMPMGEIRTMVGPLVPTVFVWMLAPKEERVYKGTLWLFIGQNRQLILAREVTLAADKVFGFAPIVIRIASIIGLLLGVVFLLARKDRLRS